MPAYPSMKDSGVWWIGPIPQGWALSKVKYVSEFAPKVSSVFNRDSPVGYVPMDCVRNGYMIPREALLSEMETGLVRFQEGDIVMAKVTPCFENGNIAVSSGLSQRIAFGSSELFVFRSSTIDQRYLFYYLQTQGFKQMCAATMTGTAGLKRVSAYFVRNAPIPVPTTSDQQPISAYLDDCCARIDTAIAEAKASIDEYKLLKQSVITQAVTKGLDLNVPMKDSGVEWIGRIPRTSTIVKLRYLVKDYKAGPFGSSLITDKLLSTGAILVYSPEHVANQSTNRLNNLYLPESRRDEMSHFFVREGEIVFPIVGSLGRAMLIISGMPPGIINQRLAKFSAREEKVDRNYLMWIFGKSSFYSEYIGVHQRGAIIVNLTKTIVGDMPVVLPSTMNDQRKIVAYLGEKCDRIDSLVAEKQATISDLESYKKSLIYEVVTGKRRVA